MVLAAQEEQRLCSHAVTIVLQPSIRAEQFKAKRSQNDLIKKQHKDSAASTQLFNMQHAFFKKGTDNSKVSPTLSQFCILCELSLQDQCHELSHQVRWANHLHCSHKTIIYTLSDRKDHKHIIIGTQRMFLSST